MEKNEKIPTGEKDKRAKTKEEIEKTFPVTESKPEPEKTGTPEKPLFKEKKIRGPNKKKEVIDETPGKVVVAGLDSVFAQFGLEPLIEEKDRKYFASVMTEGDTSFSKMYAKAFSGFFQKKFKNKIDDFETFSFYVMTLALLAIKSNEARAKGYFKELSLWQKIKSKVGKKKGKENEIVSESTE